jgi:hypothetical protein
VPQTSPAEMAALLKCLCPTKAAGTRKNNNLKQQSLTCSVCTSSAFACSSPHNPTGT